ncbi:MAG: CHAT domain-containing protein, partial [Bacteroidota bacterium]
KITQINEMSKRLENELRSTNIEKYELIHNTQITDIETVQRSLQNDEVAISYNVGSEATSLIYITGDTSLVTTVCKTATLNNLLTRYQKLLTKPDISDSAFSAYKEVSLALHDLLLSKAPLTESVQQLLIIPDDRLYFLPFESLISSAVGDSFRELDYLIHHYDIRYAQSLTMTTFLSDTKAQFKNLKVLALAPDFDQKELLPQLNSVERSAANAIPNTKEEVKAISSFFDTKILSDELATEAQFNKLHADYQVLHFATHGLVNDKKPLESKILFQPLDNDSIDDGKLHLHEILNMEIIAEMVVLSACNTGVGEINRGEGAVSLASSFFYSGARSVIMSQWPANDLSTAKIMGTFYQYLDQGFSKSAALRQAKLDYLQNEKELVLHPYYWSQFVIHGKNDALTSSQSYSAWIIAVVTLALLSGFVVWVRIMGSRRPSSA